MKDPRKIVYLEPGIYGIGMMEVLFPSDRFRLIIRRPPKKKKKRKARA